MYSSESANKARCLIVKCHSYKNHFDYLLDMALINKDESKIQTLGPISLLLVKSLEFAELTK